MTALPVAGNWFERRRVDDAITLLWEPHVHPFLRCNIWHVRGRDCDLLIDTGMGIASLTAAASDLFDRALVTVLTHTHMDHCGGACEFVEVWVHGAEAEALAQAGNHLPVDIGAWTQDEIGWIGSMGYDISGGLITAIPHAGFDPARHRLVPATATKCLADGDLVSTGDRAFEVLHLPGHSAGSIGLWEAATGTLFSGDALYDGHLLDAIPGSDPDAYLETMERLRKLPVRVVHAGHETSFGGDRHLQLIDTWLERRNP
jgi:glyoxylase-like metal-dependent hydrolase (beta-lactamase superfamily II)